MDMDLAECPEIHTIAYIRIRTRGYRRKQYAEHDSEDVDLVEDPELHMVAELWVWQHGSCRRLSMLRYESSDMVFAEEPET